MLQQELCKFLYLQWVNPISVGLLWKVTDKKLNDGKLTDDAELVSSSIVELSEVTVYEHGSGYHSPKVRIVLEYGLCL